MIEEWRVVGGWPNYEVSNMGRVRSWNRQNRGRVLAGGKDLDGYRYFILCDGSGGRQAARACRLVCSAFHGAPHDGQQTRHLNGDNTDDRAANLAWGTPADNAADRIRHGTCLRGEDHGRARLTENDVRAIRLDCPNVAAAARHYGVSESCIRDARSGKNWAWLDA